MFPLTTFSCSIRDNPQHGTAILGGMWGARMDTGMRIFFDLLFRRLIHNVKFQVADMRHMSQGIIKDKRVLSPPFPPGWVGTPQTKNVMFVIFLWIFLCDFNFFPRLLSTGLDRRGWTRQCSQSGFGQR